jgi:hypothetical protein
MYFHLKNSARVFIDPGKAEIDLFTGRLTYAKLYLKEHNGFLDTLKNKGWRGIQEYARNNPSMPLALLILLFTCLRAAGIVLFFFDKRISGLVRLFVFIFLAYFAVAAGPIAGPRYFLPVSLLAIGAAVIGFQDKFSRNPITQES